MSLFALGVASFGCDDLNAGSPLIDYGVADDDDEIEPDGDSPDSDLPAADVPIDPQRYFYMSVASGYDYSCGITDDGSRIICWGINGAIDVTREYLAMPAVPDSPRGTHDPEPGQTEPGQTWAWTQISGGRNHFCARDTRGMLSCWGDNTFGKVSHIPIRSDGQPLAFSDVSAGDDRTCAVLRDGGKAMCWGLEIGDALPQGPVQQVSSAGNQSCSIDGEQRLHCAAVAGVPGPAPDRYVKVESSSTHSCALSEARRVHCWGAEGAPLNATMDAEFIDVSTGENFACGIVEPEAKETAGIQGSDQRGPVECWGMRFNLMGELDGLAQPAYTSLSVGVRHGCAITNDSRVACWGSLSTGRPVEGAIGPVIILE